MESLGIELFYYFKSSAVRREDYEKAQSHEGIKKHIFIRHVPSRWLTLNDVIERLDEQLLALKYYFLISKFVSETNERIMKMYLLLNDKMLQVEIEFFKSIMAVFTRVTRLFQTVYPLIYNLYDELILLLNEAHHLDKPYIGHETEGIIDKIVEKKDVKLVDRPIDLFYHRVKKFYLVQKICQQNEIFCPFRCKLCRKMIYFVKRK